jgi:hypothetical protein
VKRKLSRFSTMMVDIKVQGNKSKATNIGEFVVELRGRLETKFEGTNLFLRTVWTLYSYLFYDRERKRYIDLCRSAILGFRNEIKQHFNLRVTSTPAIRGGVG